MEQYLTLVGKVCAPQYIDVFTPEVEAPLPIDTSSEGGELKDWELIGNNNPNHIDESEGALPLTTKSATAGAALDWRIDGNNVPQVESTTEVLPLTFPSNGDNVTDYTIYGNDNPCEPDQTSVLPITFETVEDKLRDWTIYGNDEPGENMVPLVTEANGWRTGYRNKDTGQYGAGQYMGEFLSPSVSVDDNTTFTIKASGMNPAYASYPSGTVYFFDASNNYIGYADFNNYSGSAISVPLGATTFDFAIRTAYNGFPAVESSDFWVMLVKGSVAPDHYIPYQQGVGERTENLFDVNEATPVTSYRFMAYTFICEPNTQYTMTQNENMLQIDIYTDSTKSELLFRAYSTASYTFNSGNHESLFFRVDELTPQSDYREKEIMIIKGSTAPASYIPYGYKIPISVQGKNLFDISTMIDPDSTGKYLKNDGTTGNDASFAYTTYIPIAAQRVRLDNVTGGAASICCYDANKNFIRGQMYYQQSVILLNTSDAAFVRFSLKPATESNAALFGLNNYTFYIGDSPLTSGQSISKTSTGIDITTQVGENTISTTLYNKPVMYCGKALGVGERTEQLLNCATFEAGHLNTDGTIAFPQAVTYINTGNGTVEFTVNTAWRGVHCDYIDVSEIEQLYFSYSGAVNNNQWRFCFYDANQTFVSQETRSGMNYLRLTVPNTVKYIRIGVQLGYAITYEFTNVSLIAGSTAPTTYIPYGYKVPIEIQSENLFDINANKEVAFTTTYKYVIDGLDVGQNYTCSTNFESNDHTNASLYFGGSSSSYNGVWASRPLIISASNSGTIDVYVRFVAYGAGAPNIYDDIVAGNLWVMVTKGSTPPISYIPYSSIKQTFYIGNSRLLSGDTYTKTQAGIDIPTTSGNNIIDTTLYNKPQMNVVCNSNVLGVGERTEIKSVLPIDFRSNGDDLLGYRIYGTADGAGVQTEQLIQAYRQGSLGNTERRDRACIVPLIDVVAGETLSFNIYDSNWKFAIYGLNEAATKTYKQTNIAFDPQYDSGWKTGAFSYTVQSGIVGIVVMTSNLTNTDFNIADCNHIVAVKGSSLPETYIPYGYKLPLTVTSGEGTKTADVYIGDSKLAAGDYVDYESGKVVRNGTPQDPPLPLPAIETFSDENTLDSTVEVGETMITQGYRIPLQIKQGATTKTIDFYIGSRPLAQGQSISRATTHSDITLYSGVNTISTSLDNKPNMMVEYVSGELGVGIRTENLFDKDNAENRANIFPYQNVLLSGGNTTSVFVPCEPNTTYTICKQAGERFIAFWTTEYPAADVSYYGEIINNTASSITITTGSNAKYVCAYVHHSQHDTTSIVDMLASIMIVKGSTAPTAYIPYGYKIPIRIYNKDRIRDDIPQFQRDLIDAVPHQTQVTLQKGQTSILFDVIGVDHDTCYYPDGRKAKHSVTVQSHDCVAELQFCARQALFTFPYGCPVGTYHFKVVNQPWYSSDVGKSMQFTLTKAIPEGGQLVINNAFNATMIGATISSYNSPTTTTALESVTMSQGTSGSNLGDVANATNGNTNSIQRVLLGSNNYQYSAIRQWLNSNGAAGSAWTPQTPFDRPPAWVSNTAGFLNGIDADIQALIGETDKITALNTVTDGGGSWTSREKVFLLSKTEVYGGNENNIAEGVAYPYYSDYSDLSAPGTGDDSNRIKYRNGSAKHWWLRSPYSGYTSYVRFVEPSGHVGYNNATGSVGVAPAFVIPMDDIYEYEDVDVYIGTSPLVNGASVTKDGTGVDIELNNGNNVIATQLYNDPTMHIK